jgi:hypothetical protein
MLVKLVSVNEKYINNGLIQPEKQIFLKEIYVNKNFIVSLQDDDRYQNLLNDKNEKQKFTMVTVNKGNMGEDIIVVGDSKLLFKKLEGAANG